MKKWWIALPALLIVALLALRLVGTKQTEAAAVPPHVMRADSLHEISSSSKYYPTAQRMDALYKELNRYKGYNCAVLVARGSNVLLARGYGYANYEKKTPINAHTAFRLASVSKPITATAALMLYDQGKLDLQKPVSDYLDGFPYDNITVDMLLSHRSGLPNYMYFAGDYLKHTKPHVVTNDEVLQMLIKHKPALKFTPGRHFQYSNTNYCLLASIIEKQSGETFGQYLQTRVFAPLQMKDSYVLGCQCNSDNVACAYTYGYEPIGDDYLDGVVGDKGICCSATDLYKFHLGLERNELLKPPTKKIAYAPHSFEQSGERNYGYGWRMKLPEHGDTVIYHNGWWHGYNNVFYQRPKDSTVVVVLSNKLNMGVYKIDNLLAILDGRETSFDGDDNDNDNSAVKPVAVSHSTTHATSHAIGKKTSHNKSSRYAHAVRHNSSGKHMASRSASRSSKQKHAVATHGTKHATPSANRRNAAVAKSSSKRKHARA